MSLPPTSITPVILCGGSGTRLWPLSRKSFPKQFVPLVDNKSLLLSYMQSGLPVLAIINPGNDLAELIQSEGVGRVCTDHSVDTLQRLAEELAQVVAGDANASARCRALSAKLFSPETAVRQIVAALAGQP